jgi:hypothetical protein
MVALKQFLRMEVAVLRTGGEGVDSIILDCGAGVKKLPKW